MKGGFGNRNGFVEAFQMAALARIVVVVRSDK
jgi:hypothetical protein